MFARAFTAPKHNKRNKCLNLPIEVQHEIWLRVYPADVFRLQAVCKKLRDLLTDDNEILWRRVHKGFV